MIKKEEIFFSKIFDKNVKINLIESLNRSGNDCKIELIIVEKKLGYMNDLLVPSTK
jgi:hypothetical protein